MVLFFSLSLSLSYLNVFVSVVFNLFSHDLVFFIDCSSSLITQASALIKDGKRILFQFDRAAFSFKFLPYKVPYPVPFRLLGDEAKGWLDTTYLSCSGNLRISRGNKVNRQLIISGYFRFRLCLLLIIETCRFPYLQPVKSCSNFLLLCDLPRTKDDQLCCCSAGHHICAAEEN